MTVQTSTGVLLAVVAAEPGTHDAAGFAALTFVAIGEVVNVPEYGASAQVVTHEPLATGITEKYKGFINYGSLAIELGHDSTDAGQVIIAAGVTGANKNVEHSFKLTYPDGAVDYWTGKFFSYTKNPGAANSIVSSTAQVEINSTIVEVAA